MSDHPTTDQATTDHATTGHPTAAATQAWRGGPVIAGVTCVLAPNPSPMTLDGTNSWLVHRPGAREAVLVDPGPSGGGHLEAVQAAADQAGVTISHLLITHGHDDHTDGIGDFLRAFDAALHFPGRDRHDIDPDGGAHRLDVDGLRIETIPVPGHTMDSAAFHVPQLRVLLTGDTVLGRGTTFVAWPDGALAPYLASLAWMRRLAVESDLALLLPGHGHPVSRPVALLDHYLAHRRERLEQVRAAVGELALHAPEEHGFADLVEHVVQTVYLDAPREVWPAARQSVRAQLDYLRTHA